MKALFPSFIVFIGFGSCFAQAATPEDSLLQNLHRQASGAATYVDFARAALPNADQRKSLEDYLKQQGLESERFPEFGIEPNGVVVVQDPAGAVRVKLSLKPRATMTLDGRVVVLADRTPEQVTNDFNKVLHDWMFGYKSTLFSLAMPRAVAAASSAPATAALPVIGVAAAGQAASPVDKVKDVIKGAKSSYEYFRCKMDGSDPATMQIQIKRPTSSPNTYFTIDNIDPNGDSFVVTRYWATDMAGDRCKFKFDSPISLASGAQAACAKNAAAVLNLENRDAKQDAKLHPKKYSASGVTKQELTVDYLIPGVPVAAMIACCKADHVCKVDGNNPPAEPRGATSNPNAVKQ